MLYITLPLPCLHCLQVIRNGVAQLATATVLLAVGSLAASKADTYIYVYIYIYVHTTISRCIRHILCF